jgi:maltooligosyltrehalose trehalohydrolase
MKSCFSDPGNPSTFQACKLDFRQREANAKAYRLHKDLMQLRREDPVFRMQKRGGVDGAVLGPEAFVLRYFGEGGDDRLLVVNLGLDLHFDPAPEPLLAPPAGRRWRTLWSSEDPRYGGCGTFPLDSQLNWRMPGQAAVALISAPESEVSDEVELPANE